MEMETIPLAELESDITLVSQGCTLTGKIIFDRFARVHGKIEGEIVGLPGSTIVIAETSSVYAEIRCDEIIIDGFVHGNITAAKKITVSESGRLLGNVNTPKFEIRFGAHFEGKATTSTSHSRGTKAPSAGNPSPIPSMA